MKSDDSIKGKRLLRRRQIKDRIGVSYSTIANWRKVGGRWYDPTFPQPIQLGANSVGFFEDEIEAWLASRNRVSSQGTGNVLP